MDDVGHPFFINKQLLETLENKAIHRFTVVNKVFLFDNFFWILKALKSHYQLTNNCKLITFDNCDKKSLPNFRFVFYLASHKFEGKNVLKSLKIL